VGAWRMEVRSFEEWKLSGEEEVQLLPSAGVS
jgi:hypothetical protein